MLVNYEYKPQCGGAGLGTYNMAKAFQQMGHNVTLLIGWDYKYGQPEILNNVDTYIIKTKKKNIHQSTALGLLKFVIAGLFKINQITRKKHIDIIQFYFSVPTGILKYGIHKKIPYVISLRGMDIPGFRNDKYKLLSKLTRSINYSVVKSAVAVTSLSAAAGKYFTEFAPDIRLDIIPNAVEYEMYHVKKDYAKQISKFVAVSRLTGFKNLDLMIQAFVKIHENYPSVILDIYGEGRERENLEQLIKLCQAESFIKLKGYANRQKLVEVLPEYDVFSLMSIGDSFGIVFIEAMSVGLPVICAKAGGPEEIVLDHETGMFAKPNDLEDTVQVIEFCIQNPELMEEMGKKGRKRVEECYSVVGVAKKHIDLYERCLNREV
ncbi:MAG: glycosyltransferase family 4 protein [Lachnospiraceae bacterium]|nr:glycosyltransferase family 4 protein [Lachnospiraceae bacterium]